MRTTGEAVEELRVSPVGEKSEATPTVDALELFLREVGRYPLLEAREEVEFAKRIERGDKGAKDMLINSNLRLVVSLAGKYHNQHLTLLDVIQEGILGLIRATEKFDWRRGHRFSTYATWWIREAIERGIANRARMIRMPVYMVECERKVRHLERTLTAELGREPTDVEIASEARLPTGHVRTVREAARTVASLDAPVGAGDELSLGDTLECGRPEPIEEVEAAMRRECLRTALGKLPEPEREIVKLRYGIDEEPRTIEQVMARLGLSRGRVRRLEAQGLARLARASELQSMRVA